MAWLLIPVNEVTKLPDDDTRCLVVLPDPVTGASDEMYWAYPIMAPELSEQYDIAFLEIHDVYYDAEEKKAYGDFPKKISYIHWQAV